MRRISVCSLITALLVCAPVVDGLAASQAGDQPAPAAAAKEPPPVRLSGTANGVGLRLQFAVKDLTPGQKKQSIPILQQLDAEYGPVERAKREEHETRMSNALKTQTKIDLAGAGMRDSMWSRRMYRIENKFEDRIRDEVLTAKQRPVWDATTPNGLSARRWTSVATHCHQGTRPPPKYFPGWGSCSASWTGRWKLNPCCAKRWTSASVFRR